ncbi:MAG: RNA polymerase sigma factor [Beijerinckiaceae bacterium]
MTAQFTNELIATLPRVRRFALSLTGKADEADDLVQATCERALKAQAQWEPGSRLDAWLFRIAKNLWIDEIRKRRVAGPMTPIEDAPEAASEDGRDVAEGRLALESVTNAMNTLSPEHRQVLSLVCIQEISYKEAAEHLGVPIGTVMSRLARARQALAQKLEPRGQQGTQNDRNRRRTP